MSRIYSLMAMAGLCVFAAGCRDRDDQPVTDQGAAPAPVSDAGQDEHSHGEGPHGGVIVDWGGGAYHVEFTVDHEKQEATVYVLDSDAESPASIDAEMLLLSIRQPAFQVELMPVPLDGEAEGTSSRFVGQHEQLGLVQEFAGTISGDVNGTPYAGDFEEEPS